MQPDSSFDVRANVASVGGFLFQPKDRCQRQFENVVLVTASFITVPMTRYQIPVSADVPVTLAKPGTGPVVLHANAVDIGVTLSLAQRKGEAIHCNTLERLGADRGNHQKQEPGPGRLFNVHCYISPFVPAAYKLQLAIGRLQTPFLEITIGVIYLAKFNKTVNIIKW
jgi:hypothetical protein